MYRMVIMRAPALALLAVCAATAASGQATLNGLVIKAVAEVEIRSTQDGRETVKLAPANRVVPGDQVIYTLEIRNTGAAAVHAPTVTHRRRAGKRLVDVGGHPRPGHGGVGRDRAWRRPRSGGALGWRPSPFHGAARRAARPPRRAPGAPGRPRADLGRSAAQRAHQGTSRRGARHAR